MDHLRRSSLNYFTSAGLDRMTEYRSDENYIKKLLSGNSSYIIFLHKLKNLVSNNTAVLIPANKACEIYLNLNSIILLGRSNGNTYFAANVPSDDAFILKKLEAYGSFVDLRKIAHIISSEDASLLAYSRAMVYWHIRHKYCGECGSHTIIKDAGQRIICSNTNCSYVNFPRTDPAIIVLIADEQKCLLARQQHWQKGQYATIAGFVEPGEALEQAASREIFEETGITIDEIYYHSSQPWPFPSSIMLGFTAVPASTEITLKDKELEDAQWFTRKEIEISIREKKLIFPPPVSISFRLIEDWFNINSRKKIRETLSEIQV